ncbi:MAG: hypothetical protein IJJ11_04150 [Methanosphaera sp.]|nr:hypothetical protein [Methanosphaera sp.]
MEANIYYLSVDNFSSVYIYEHTDTGIMECIIVLDGFDYNGAISEALVENNEKE